MAVLILLNNFLHDFGAAGWLVCSVLLAVMLRHPVDQYNDMARAMFRTIRRIMQLSLFAIVVFGLVRAWAYSEYEWNEAAGMRQITLLIVKHVLLVFIFAPGVAYYLKATRHLKELNNHG